MEETRKIMIEISVYLNTDIFYIKVLLKEFPELIEHLDDLSKEIVYMHAILFDESQNLKEIEVYVDKISRIFQLILDKLNYIEDTYNR